MSETTQEDRDAFRVALNSAFFLDLSATRALLNDADRLDAIEREVRELADEEMDAARYMKTTDPERAYRQRCRARRLRAILAPEGD